MHLFRCCDPFAHDDACVCGALWSCVEQGIDDVCMKYLVEAGVIGVRRCKKEDLRRIAAATGGTLLPNLADLEGGETFDAAHLGRAEEVSEEKVGDGTWHWNALYPKSMVSLSWVWPWAGCVGCECGVVQRRRQRSFVLHGVA